MLPGGPSPVPSSTVGTTPASFATSAPVTASGSVVTNIAAGTVRLSLALPVATAGVGATLAITAYGGLPAQIAPLGNSTSGGPPASPIATLAIVPSATVSFTTTFGFVAALPSGSATGGTSYYVAQLAPGSAQWSEPYLGPAAQQGTTLDIAPYGNATTLNAGQSYTYALYQIATPSLTDDWSTYAHDEQRTGYQQAQNNAIRITPQNVSSLQLAWSVQPDPACESQAVASGVVADEASPLVYNGLVYYADACGYVAALDRVTGATVWHQQLALAGPMAGPLGTPTIDTANGTLIVPVWGSTGSGCPGSTCVPANGGYLAAFDATSGAPKWSTAPLRYGNMRGEPFVLNGVVFEGVSGGDIDTGLVNGGLLSFRESDGTPLSSFYFAPGGAGLGDGGATWSPISYDQASNTIYFGTGNTFNADGLTDAVLGFNPTSFVPTTFMVRTHLQNYDEDVGGGELIWGGNLYFTGKNGFFYGYSLTSGTPLFAPTQMNFYPQGGAGGISTPTTDGNVMTASSGDNLGNYQSDLDCYHVGSGTPFTKIQATNSSIYSYAAYVNGLGFIGIDNQLPIGTPPGANGPQPAFVAFDDSCTIVWRAPANQTRSFFYAGPAVTQSGVYAIDNAGNVYAWKLPYQMGMQLAKTPAERARAGARVNLRFTRFQQRRRGP